MAHFLLKAAKQFAGTEFENVSLFGSALDMTYFGTEDKCGAHILWLMQGARRYVLSPFSSLSSVLGATALKSTAQCCANMSIDPTYSQDYQNTIYCTDQPANSILYVPSGFVLGERPLNTAPVFGVKMMLAVGAGLSDLKRLRERKRNT